MRGARALVLPESLQARQYVLPLCRRVARRPLAAGDRLALRHKFQGRLHLRHRSDLPCGRRIPGNSPHAERRVPIGDYPVALRLDAPSIRPRCGPDRAAAGLVHPGPAHLEFDAPPGSDPPFPDRGVRQRRRSADPSPWSRTGRGIVCGYRCALRVPTGDGDCRRRGQLGGTPSGKRRSGSQAASRRSDGDVARRSHRHELRADKDWCDQRIGTCERRTGCRRLDFNQQHRAERRHFAARAGSSLPVAALPGVIRGPLPMERSYIPSRLGTGGRHGVVAPHTGCCPGRLGRVEAPESPGDHAGVSSRVDARCLSVGRR